MKLNYRSVKRVNNVYQCLKSSLCDDCGVQAECPTLKSKSRLERKSGASMMITHCPSFVYCLMFQNRKGTHLESFNTIRLGKSWSERLKEGDKVALVDKTGVYGFAEVLTVGLDTVEKIVMNHAYLNHLYIEQNLSQEEAGKDLLKKMPSIYGNLIFKNNTHATVIYLVSLQ